MHGPPTKLEDKLMAIADSNSDLDGEERDTIRESANLIELLRKAERVEIRVRNRPAPVDVGDDIA